MSSNVDVIDSEDRAVSSSETVAECGLFPTAKLAFELLMCINSGNPNLFMFASDSEQSGATEMLSPSVSLEL